MRRQKKIRAQTHVRQTLNLGSRLADPSSPYDLSPVTKRDPPDGGRRGGGSDRGGEGPQGVLSQERALDRFRASAQGIEAGQPAALLRNSALCAAVTMPAILGALVGFAVDLPGIPPGAGVFLPGLVLIPFVMFQLTLIKT